MNQIIRTLTLWLFVVGLTTGCQSPQTGSGAASVNRASDGSFFPSDRTRNVLSFADTLESVLPSVVLIGNLQLDAGGQPQLAGLGSGAVIDAEQGYICLLYTSPSPRDQRGARMPSSA